MIRENTKGLFTVLNNGRMAVKSAVWKCCLWT